MNAAEAIQRCIDKVTELTLQMQDMELKMLEISGSIAKLQKQEDDKPPWD